MQSLAVARQVEAETARIGRADGGRTQMGFRGPSESHDSHRKALRERREARIVGVEHGYTAGRQCVRDLTLLEEDSVLVAQSAYVILANDGDHRDRRA